MSKYNIDFDNFVKLNTPPHRRTAKMLAWLRALVEPIKTVQTDFDSFRTKQVRRAGTTSQQLVLETSLNDEFGITSDPRIRVSTPVADGVYVGYDDPATSGVGNNEEGASWEVAIQAEVLDEDRVGEDFSAVAADILVKYPSGKLTAAQVEILDGLVQRYKFLTLTHTLNAV